METKKSLRFISRNFKNSSYFYFNYANFAKVPKSVIRETKKFFSLYNFGSIHFKKIEKYCENVRSHLAGVFGGVKSQWFFGGPVSQVISNVLLQLIRDYININKTIPVVSSYKMNFPSLILPVLSLESQNLCKFNLLEYPENGIDENWCNENINSNIFLMSLVDFYNGQIHDIELINSYCIKKNIVLIVDFSQFPYWGILDVSKYKNTIFVSVLHKWLLGLPGHSIAYINLPTKPFFMGWQNMKNIFDYNINDFSNTFEISNKSPLAFSSFEGAFKLINLIGFDKINRYISNSREYLLEKLTKLESKYNQFNVKNFNSSFIGKKSSIFSVSINSKVLKGKDISISINRKLFDFLLKNKIISSYFPIDSIRISTSFITSKEEIDFLIDKIEEFLRNNS
ncbi:MAG: aminotransferase class V-fold PLP-dependent enzyme [Exilispira sp.]